VEDSEKMAHRRQKTQLRSRQIEIKRPTHGCSPAVTTAIVLSAFCLYYFVYVRARREHLENRNFRALATLGDQLQTIVSIHGSVLEY
jgi:hypothetical protein